MGDDEWQVATGKRTRPFKAVENPSKRFKSPPDDLMMNLQEPKPSFTLQTISKKKKQKQRVLGPDGIVTKDLQNLIFWIYDIGINQKWIMIKVLSFYLYCILIEYIFSFFVSIFLSFFIEQRFDRKNCCFINWWIESSNIQTIYN